MTWAALLLADPSPCLRRLVLRDLLGRAGDDAEVAELAAATEDDPLVNELVAAQRPDGSWAGAGPDSTLDPTRATSLALARLGYLGLGPEHPLVQRGAEYVFGQQRPDGSWPLPERDDDSQEGAGYTMMPLQTALPLRGLAACGLATDPRAERAYDWLLARRLPEGAWPTGIAADDYGYVAGYRRLAHSRWGCRSNTTAALVCLALHPERCHSPAAGTALDLLLGRETRERQALGHDLARLLGLAPARGFITFYARFDLAQVLDLCARVGAGTDDARVAALVAAVRGWQGPYGLWTDEARPQAARWVSYDLLRSLARLGEPGEWVGLEPRTPFSPYPRRLRRF